MKKEQFAILVPGLDDRTRALSLATDRWKNVGIETLVHPVGWRNGQPFQPKLQGIVALIDDFSSQGKKVSLVGVSAGGSAVVNAFIERKDVIDRVVTVCSRLKRGTAKGPRGFDRREVKSPAFGESVRLLEDREDELSIDDRKRIMTIRAKFGDQAVPPETAILEGALNTQVPTLEHMFSIGVSLRSKPILLFLKGEQRET